MSYTVCPNCGQKALTVATRCPRCGLAFEAQFLGRAVTTPKPRRTPLGFLIAGAVVTLVVANALIKRFEIAPPPTSPQPALKSTPAARPQPQPLRESLAADAESLDTAPSPPSRSPSESLPSPSPGGGAAAPRPTAEPVAPVAPAAAERRYASTWMNVRAGRRNTAPVLRILRPGEVVQVDSLERGWYRVLSDRLPPGYVDRRLLDTAPPSGSP